MHDLPVRLWLLIVQTLWLVVELKGKQAYLILILICIADALLQWATDPNFKFDFAQCENIVKVLLIHGRQAKEDHHSVERPSADKNS